jgi:hypothetical protein
MGFNSGLKGLIMFCTFTFWPLAEVSYHGKLVITVSGEAVIDQSVEELIQSHTEHQPVVAQWATCCLFCLYILGIMYSGRNR